MRLNKLALLAPLSIAAVALLVACSESPTQPASPAQLRASATLVVDPTYSPDWILNPVEFPDGRKGKNNCSYPFGQATADWDFHSDGGCWEHQGPDGWTRNQQFNVHVASLAACAGKPGDVSPIRVCHEGGPMQVSPCYGFLTGPNGCALCVPKFECHAVS